MLDKLSLMVLKELNNLSPLGELIVISKNDLMKLLNNKIEVSVLDNTILHLKQNDYIMIKYADNEDICFASLSKTRRYFEQQQEKQKAKRILSFQIFLNCLISGICAFLGALLACFIVRK